jgi:hypothetical protein
MTSPSPLEHLAGPGNVLGKEPPDAKEFDGLVHSGLARLKDAENEANLLETRFDLAYGAAHALCFGGGSSSRLSSVEAVHRLPGLHLPAVLPHERRLGGRTDGRGYDQRCLQLSIGARLK